MVPLIPLQNAVLAGFCQQGFCLTDRISNLSHRGVPCLFLFVAEAEIYRFCLYLPINDILLKTRKPLESQRFKGFLVAQIFNGLSLRSTVFDRFFIVNKGLTAVFRAFFSNASFR